MDVDMDIDIDGDNDTNDSDSELKDLEHLTSALISDPECTFQGKEARLKSLLASNKLADERLLYLENSIIDILMKRHKPSINLLKDDHYNRQIFRSKHCGKPYFKDNKGFVPPDNDDTISMKKAGMYDFSTIVAVPGWTVKDKGVFDRITLKATKTLKLNELNNKIALLRRDMNISSCRKKQNIKEIEAEIAKVKKCQSLKQLALPIDTEFDWDRMMTIECRHSSEEYRRMWKLFAHPSLNKSSWTKEEHVRLDKLAEEHDFQDWDLIAKKHNSNRTGYQCFVYHRTNSGIFIKTTWTREEEEYLKRLIEYYRENNYIPWGKVTACMENRTKIQVYNKFKRLTELRKGRFLPEEDAVLLSCVKQYGTDFHKIKKYVPGRSIAQLKTRHNVLTKQISVVWTASEDKLLLQLIASQENKLNYSSLCKHFPDKDRANIRARYGTLLKWMLRNPNVDISHAPRRAARRLCHGNAAEDLNNAVEKLENRMQNEVENKKSQRITRDSSEQEIEDSIIAFLVTENVHQEEHNQSKKEHFAIVDNKLVLVGDGLNAFNLKKMLMFLKSKLNRKLFEESNYKNRFAELLRSEENVSLVTIKSYSRKRGANPVEVMTKLPDIWGNKTIRPTEYVLPPNLATITACKTLISLINAKELPRIDLFPLTRKHLIFREQMHSLIDRFNTLFMWPLLLSNEVPSTNQLNCIRNVQLLPSTSNKETNSSSSEEHDSSDESL